MGKKSIYIMVYLVGFLFTIGACSNNTAVVAEPSGVELTPAPVEGEGTSREVAPSSEIENSLVPTSLCAKVQPDGPINCYESNGQLSATLQTPGVDSADPQRIHIAQNMANGTQSPSVVYHAWEPRQALLYSENGSVTQIKETGAFLAVAGAPARPVIAYSEVGYENGASHSFMFAGTPLSLVNAEAFYDFKDETTGFALMPVAVESTGDQAQKVWYTQTAWGIGGVDIIFPINRGLFVFDLATGQNFQGLDNTRNFQGLSPDNKLAGSTDFELAGDQSMRITNISTGQNIQFSLDPASDRGAGNAVFNYDERLTAWQEASGSRVVEPSTFTTRIRVGDITSGAIIHEVQTKNIETILGWQQISYVNSVGWFNNHILVIEVRGNNWDTAALVIFDTNTGSLTKFCEGSFVGFLY